jgi:hypothetical protein
MSKAEITIQKIDLIDFFVCLLGGLFITTIIIYSLQFTNSVHCAPVFTENYYIESSSPQLIGFNSSTTKARISFKSYFGSKISVSSKEFGGTIAECDSFQIKSMMASKGLEKDFPVTLIIGLCAGLLWWILLKYLPKIKIQN